MNVEPRVGAQPAMITTLGCPQCGAPAAVEWWTELRATDADVIHVKVRCLDRHWFLMPADELSWRVTPVP